MNLLNKNYLDSTLKLPLQLNNLIIQKRDFQNCRLAAIRVKRDA